MSKTKILINVILRRICIFKMCIFCAFRHTAFLSHNWFWKNGAKFKAIRSEGNKVKNFKGSEILFLVQKPVYYIFISFFITVQNCFYDIHIVNWVWLWRQIISKYETFCLHPHCCYSCRSAWSNRCDKWHIILKMPDRTGCRCLPIITSLHLSLGLLKMLTALSIYIYMWFFFIRNNSKLKVLGNS